MVEDQEVRSSVVRDAVFGSLPPGLATWRAGRVGVLVEDGYAKIVVSVTKNTQKESAP